MTALPAPAENGPVGPSRGSAHEPVYYVAEIAAMCAENAPIPERAAEVLQRLRQLMSFDAAALSMFDPFDGRHLTMASQDYPDTVLAHLNGRFTEDDPAFVEMRYRDPRPLRWCDIDRYEVSYSVTTVFVPSGFHEGVTTCMFTPTGRYTGSLHLSMDRDRPLADEAVRCLQALSSSFAKLLDGQRVLHGPGPGVPADATAATLWRAGGEIAALPGIAQGAHLGDPAGPLYDLVSAAAGLGEPREWSFFWADGTGGTHRVRMTPVEVGWLIVLEDQRPPYGITSRELQVLQELALGLSNNEIGGRLFVSPRTVATHVENLLGKLSCNSRVAAVGTAVAQGIVLPVRGN